MTSTLSMAQPTSAASHFWGASWHPEIPDHDEQSCTLYRAQTAAKLVVRREFFPCYSPSYVKSRTGLSAGAIKVYSMSYQLVSSLYQAVFTVARAIYHLAAQILRCVDYCFGIILRPIARVIYKGVESPVKAACDLLFPLNHVNGKRRLMLLSRSVEKALGDHLIYPLTGKGLSLTFEADPSSENPHRSLADRVEGVTQRLRGSNAQLLNPAGEKPFNYRVETVHSSKINAYAVPGGGMRVFSQLIKQAKGALETQRIQQSTVTLADGSRVVVDLRGVQLEDVLAALMGHEMTHVASRHGFGAISLSFARIALVALLSRLSLWLLDAKDAKEGVVRERSDRFKRKEQVESVIERVDRAITSLLNPFLSRENEFEADATGAYMAHRAGFNPLGALFLQELLDQQKCGGLGLDQFDFLSTHPCAERRKRALLAALREIDSGRLAQSVQRIEVAAEKYDPERSGLAVQYGMNIDKLLAH